MTARPTAFQGRVCRIGGWSRIEIGDSVVELGTVFGCPLGITSPIELARRDPYALYDDFCRIGGQRHDPCLLDTFIAVVRFMEGGPNKSWWAYTAERKRELTAREARNQ